MSAYYDVLEPYKDQVEVHSFIWTFLSNLDAMDSDFTTVAIGSGDLTAKLSTMPSCIDKVSWKYDDLFESRIQAAHDAGKGVYAWTVDDPGTMQDAHRLERRRHPFEQRRDRLADNHRRDSSAGITISSPSFITA